MAHQFEERPKELTYKTQAKAMPRECPVKAKVVEKLLKEKK